MNIFDSQDDACQQALQTTKARLASADHLEEVVETIRALGRAVCAADGICMVLREDGLCHYVIENAIGPLWRGKRFDMNTCISGWSMLNGQTVAISDVFADPRIPHDVYRSTFVKSLIVTPVSKPESGPVAALAAYWAANRSFAPGEIVRLEQLALAVGEAMERIG